MKGELFRIEVRIWREVDIFKPVPLKFMVYAFNCNNNNNNNRQPQRMSISCGM